MDRREPLEVGAVVGLAGAAHQEPLQPHPEQLLGRVERGGVPLLLPLPLRLVPLPVAPLIVAPLPVVPLIVVAVGHGAFPPERCTVLRARGGGRVETALTERSVAGLRRTAEPRPADR
ncbi:hypothetical protein GCM10009663_36460 [Kitasatospora arboriphila]|uniref:Uncharacterized protein n=1 Tax=Kitasatospora arboriphila TaxID=258052 RepID=A0ABN1TJ27_9ACTN